MKLSRETHSSKNPRGVTGGDDGRLRIAGWIIAGLAALNLNSKSGAREGSRWGKIWNTVAGLAVVVLIVEIIKGIKRILIVKKTDCTSCNGQGESRVVPEPPQDGERFDFVRTGEEWRTRTENASMRNDRLRQ